MKYFLMISTLGFLAGCGDNDEDTGSDTAEVVDTSDTSDSEQIKIFLLKGQFILNWPFLLLVNYLAAYLIPAIDTIGY